MVCPKQCTMAMGELLATIPAFEVAIDSQAIRVWHMNQELAIVQFGVCLEA